jgi:hypothetical protein
MADLDTQINGVTWHAKTGPRCSIVLSPHIRNNGPFAVDWFATISEQRGVIWWSEIGVEVVHALSRLVLTRRYLPSGRLGIGN